MELGSLLMYINLRLIRYVYTVARLFLLMLNFVLSVLRNYTQSAQNVVIHILQSIQYVLSVERIVKSSRQS